MVTATDAMGAELQNRHTAVVIKTTLSISALIFLLTSVFYFGVCFEKLSSHAARLDKVEGTLDSINGKLETIQENVMVMKQKQDDGK